MVHSIYPPVIVGRNNPSKKKNNQTPKSQDHFPEKRDLMNHENFDIDSITNKKPLLDNLYNNSYNNEYWTKQKIIDKGILLSLGK